LQKKGTIGKFKNTKKYTKNEKNENNIYVFFKKKRKENEKIKQKNSFEKLQRFIMFFVASLVVPNSFPCCIVILLETKVANPLQQVTMSFQILFLFQTKTPNTHEKEEKITRGKT
jgi:hypothetical protein